MKAVETTINKIFSTRQITRRDQQTLMLLFSQGNLTAADKELINRVYEALSQGLLKVVD